ncbi:MAG TPA: DUF5658 family protein [Acidimicrobiales bacterium]
MPDDRRPTVWERRAAERRLDLRDAAPDRRRAPRRAGDQRPADLRAADVVIDLRDGQAMVAVLPDADQVLARRWFLLAILGALNLLDLVTTRLVLNAGGQEANPIMAPIIHHPFAPALVKTAGFVLVAMVLKACPTRSAIVDRALVGVTGLYMAIVSWNLLNLLMHA